MGYLDGTSITVDAVLTKKGREILSDPSQGGLNITSFTCTDTGVDYTLWNPDHPSGSAFYGEAIENLPMLEANVHAEYSLSNRLISLNRSTVAVPALELSGQSGTHLHQFDSTRALNLTVTLIGFSPSSGTGNTANQSGLYYVVQNPNLVTTNGDAQDQISGTTMQFMHEADIPGAIEYNLAGQGPTWTFNVRPIRQSVAGRETNIYVVHRTSGAYAQLRIINNMTEQDKTNISPSNIIGTVS